MKSFPLRPLAALLTAGVSLLLNSCSSSGSDTVNYLPDGSKLPKEEYPFDDKGNYREDWVSGNGSSRSQSVASREADTIVIDEKPKPPKPVAAAPKPLPPPPPVMATRPPEPQQPSAVAARSYPPTMAPTYGESLVRDTPIVEEVTPDYTGAAEPRLQSTPPGTGGGGTAPASTTSTTSTRPVAKPKPVAKPTPRPKPTARPIVKTKPKPVVKPKPKPIAKAKAKPKPTAKPVPRPTLYKVRKGDTLYSISRKTGRSVSELRSANGSAVVRDGTMIKIPARR